MVGTYCGEAGGSAEFRGVSVARLWFQRGHIGQGWEGFISEVRQANSSLSGGRVTRDDNQIKEVPVRRSYAEVLSQPVEERFNAFSEPIARVPRWLKEASKEMDKLARETDKRTLEFKKTTPPVMTSDGFTRVLRKPQAKEFRLAEEGVFNLQVGGLSEKIQSTRQQSEVSSLSYKAKVQASKIGQVLLKGREGPDKDGQLLLDARLELLLTKESLEKARSAADVGLERLESVVKILEICRPGLGSKVQQKKDYKGKKKLEVEGFGSKPTRAFKPKRKMVFRPKGPVVLGEESKGDECLPTHQAASSGLVGQRKSSAESSGGVGSSSEASSASLGMGNGDSGWFRLGIPVSKIGVLGPLPSTLLLPKLGMVEPGESFGGRDQIEKHQIVPIGHLEGWAPLSSLVQCRRRGWWWSA
ncbi:hypothetical protein FH972_005567 [Carpinus fangiana]|uniref:Uncharacterized protein n=1 Tax=Carpinus fangiana TaxID=176857 RepID=A0A5N6QSJ8_9ROSI|nr:hypothetical protein FH972_005567 [Carpinus fangiana]